MPAPPIAVTLRRPLLPRPRRLVTPSATVFVLCSLLRFATPSATVFVLHSLPRFVTPSVTLIILRSLLLPPLTGAPLRTSPSATAMVPLALARLTLAFGLSFLQPLGSRRRRARTRGRIRRTGPNRFGCTAAGILVLVSRRRRDTTAVAA